jgi:hypothetical protein
MININKKELKEIKKLSEILSDHGIFTINNYLLKNEVSELKEEVLHHHKIYGKSYPFGSTYSIRTPKELPNESFQKRTFSNAWMKELFLDYNNNISKGFFESLYSTHDYKFDGNIGRNGYLHFDRNSSLKFFLYLNDVTEDNGAFYIQTGSHKLGKKLRESAWGSFMPLPNDSLLKKILNKTFGINFKNVKNRLELDYPELFEPKKLVPVEGKAGTLIVFDSDIFHQGGKINIHNKERVVLRSHNYLSV